jgi:hypothetical protein
MFVFILCVGSGLAAKVSCRLCKKGYEAEEVVRAQQRAVKPSMKERKDSLSPNQKIIFVTSQLTSL